MPDPRIARTKAHVLATLRRLLNENTGATITITSLAEAASVSRRTIYTHWGTIENVVTEAVALEHTERLDAAKLAALPLRARLETFLFGVRDVIAEPVTAVSLLTIMMRASQNDDAVASMRGMTDVRVTQFREIMGPISQEDYNQIVGPIFFAEFVVRERISDAGLLALVDRGVDLLEPR